MEAFSADGNGLRGEGRKEDLQNVVSIDDEQSSLALLSRGEPRSENTPIRRHERFGDCTYVEFGQHFLRASPRHAGDSDITAIISAEWQKLPVVDPTEQALVHFGTEPDLNTGYPVEHVASRIERLRSQDLRQPQGQPEQLGPQELRSLQIAPAQRGDGWRSLSCSRRSVSAPRTSAGTAAIADAATASARGAVQAIQKSHAVAWPLLVCGLCCSCKTR